MTGSGGNPGAPAVTSKPKLLQQVRDAIRRKHFSPRTEESYVHKQSGRTRLFSQACVSGTGRARGAAVTR